MKGSGSNVCNNQYNIVRIATAHERPSLAPQHSFMKENFIRNLEKNLFHPNLKEFQ